MTCLSDIKLQIRVTVTREHTLLGSKSIQGSARPVCESFHIGTVCATRPRGVFSFRVQFTVMRNWSLYSFTK